MIPEGWDKTQVQSIGKVIRGASPRPKGDPRYYGGSVPRLMVEDVTRDGKYVTPKIDSLTVEGAKKSRPLPAGSLTIVCSGVVGVPSILAVDCCIHDGFLALSEIDEKRCSVDYLYEIFSSLQQRFHSSATHGGVFTNLTTTILKEFEFLLPPLGEQNRIIKYLNTWNRAIEKTEALIKAKERRKAGLMQRLLTGKVRFGEFVGEAWKEMSIGKLLRQVKRPVVWDDDASYKLLSLRRASGGLFHRQTLRGSEILTKKMNMALEGDFLISKMQVVHGATGLTTAEFDGYHVSDSYLSYVARDSSTLDIRFFNWLCKTKEMYHKAYRSSYGVHIEKMTFNPKLWLKETIMLPPTTEEQAKIVQVLDTAVAEIDEHRNQLAALKEQKKGLMQQLLTGKVRVNHVVPNDRNSP